VQQLDGFEVSTGEQSVFLKEHKGPREMSCHVPMMKHNEQQKNDVSLDASN
jgi:hypothetical protein